MTDEDIVVRLTDHESRIRVSEHRLKDLEAQQKEIQSLTNSVSELAHSMKSMCDEQKEQHERLKKLEEVPATNWNNLVKTIVAAFASGMVGYLLAVLIK